MAQQVTAIFDIGKTNKKFFLFDENLQEIKEEYIKIPMIMDDEGEECDDLNALSVWVMDKVKQIIDGNEYELKALNFSTYGASLVHIDDEGKPVTPIYNYLKTFPEDLHQEFYGKYPESSINLTTASPTLGMLNSGLQIYWLKRKKPEIFKKIKYSLHLPQYISFLFTGEALSEPTSIGCHTKLWDFSKNTYHDWVYEEKIDSLLPKIMPSTHTVKKELGGNMVKIGIGIHDSSSALASYLVKVKDPFLLISTGTWSISLNPYPEENLSISNLQNDGLNFLSIQGKTVKASRFFLGYELDHQVSQLNQIFKKNEKYYKKINPDLLLISKMLDGEIENSFYPATIAKTPLVKDLFPEDRWNPEAFTNYEEAYHQVIWGLTRMQVASLKMAQGNSPIRKVYIDGGFVHNQVFIHLLRHFLEGYTLEFSDFPLGSAYGAALMLDGDQ